MNVKPKEGKGIYKDDYGAIYNGNWRNYKMHGQGTLTFKNGDVYKGEFLNNSMRGEGEMYYKKKGYVVTGIWNKDELVETTSTIRALTVTRAALEECPEIDSSDQWLELIENGIPVALHNPIYPETQLKMFDVSETIDDTKICSHIFMKDVYEKNFKGDSVKNPWTNQNMPEDEVEIYKLYVVSQRSRSKSRSKSRSRSRSRSRSKGGKRTRRNRR